MRLEFLRPGLTPNQATITGIRRPLGYQQLTLTGSAQHLTLPTMPAGVVLGYVVIQCEGTTAVARWRDDGAAPTSSVGMILNTGNELDYVGDATALQFITGSGSPILDVSYYA